MQMAADDLIWWIAAWVYAYDPRMKTPRQPFVPYDYQVDALLGLRDSIEMGRNELWEKARDMGATYLALLCFNHYWLFAEERSFLCVSRNEDYVDKTDNPKALFWKLDYTNRNLPGWMCPPEALKKPYRTHMHMLNPRTQSVIDGEATTSDVARGDRRTAIFFDEFAAFENGDEALAASADSSPCRLFVSTPKGRSNAFARLRFSGSLLVRTFHWWQHPVKARGLYTTKGEKIIRLDEWRGRVVHQEGEEIREYSYPENYPFVPDTPGFRRSPWFDQEEKSRASEKELAQEVLIDYGKSGDAFFDPDVLTRHRSEFGCPPWHVGTLRFAFDYEKRRVRLTGWEKGGGRQLLRLWFNPDASGYPQWDHNYCMGVDISEGTNASNSVASVWDVNTREKVAEWAMSHLAPERFAHHVAALAYWFAGELGHCYLVWESNGPGLIFGSEIMDLGFTYVYYRRNEMSTRPGRGNVPGFHSSREGKEKLLGDYRRRLARGDLVNRCVQSLDEAMTYEYQPNGQLSPAKIADETTSARESHGDRVIADALGVLGLEMQPKAMKALQWAKTGSPAWRRQQRGRKTDKMAPWGA